MAEEAEVTVEEGMKKHMTRSNGRTRNDTSGVKRYIYCLISQRQKSFKNNDKIMKTTSSRPSVKNLA